MNDPSYYSLVAPAPAPAESPAPDGHAEIPSAEPPGDGPAAPGT
ncbi:hypothetical protein ACIQF6_01815 [Kitasatospora sp. NPDC092948]